jgi:phosphatidylserine/phosphatidylglycerophosphate/cardiolipin synthase-like enzyme
MLTLPLILAGCHSFKSLPDGISYQGEHRATEEVVFLSDSTWIDQEGQRQVEQTIFDDLFQIIAGAEKLIVLDMFLYNDFQGPVPETTRALSSELTDALIARKAQVPDINIVVITDPLNTLYGGLPFSQFEQLEAAGIPVVITDLRQLRDSNTVYSFFWRIFIKPFGNTTASTLPNPVGPGRVSLRTYFELVNFKANHRKALVADQGDNYVGFVTSANPHDGSSAHRNAAIRFTGAAVADLLETENAVLALSGHPAVELDLSFEGVPDAESASTVQVVTEAKIKEAYLSLLQAAGPGDRLDLMMFYLSDRTIVKALKSAHEQGADLRVLLDPNKDAFGREKNGIPNRSVASELVKAGLDVRWCATQGEQCHTKMLLVNQQGDRATLISGSANLTRRNLEDFNLETNVVVTGTVTSAPFTDAQTYFDDAWHNTGGREYSVDYAHYKDESLWRRGLYRFMEWSGISSF